MMAERRDSMGLLPAPEERKDPPVWFVQAMHDGIVGLCRFALDRKPRPPTTVEDEELKMAEGFAEATWPGRVWVEERDRSRIVAAFALLAAGHRVRHWEAGKFPNVDDLLDALPRRAEDSPARIPPVDHIKARDALARIRERIRR